MAEPSTRVIARAPPSRAVVDAAVAQTGEALGAGSAAASVERPSEGARAATTVQATELGRYLGLMGITPAFAWPDAPEGSAAPPMAGRLQVLGPLGSGGLGEVLRVWDGALLRPVALKRMRAEHRRDPLLVQSFLEEAMLAARLEHPNIVPIYTIGVTPEDGPFYTMKVLSGETLAELLGRLRQGDAETARRFPLARRVAVVVEALRAMAHAHGRGVLHCDLKPSNLLVGPDGEVTLVDWGLALALGEAGSRQARARMWSGTPGYMPPEQCLRQDIGALGPRSDVWALGAILYEVLSLAVPQAPPGETAFKGHVRPSPEAGRAASGGGWERAWVPCVPLELRGCPELPAPLARICARALAEDPEARHEDAGALFAEVSAWLEGRQDEERAASELAEATAEADEVADRLGRGGVDAVSAARAARALAQRMEEVATPPLSTHRAAARLYWALVRALHSGGADGAEPLRDGIDALAARGVPDARTLTDGDWLGAMERLAQDGLPRVAALVWRMRRLAETSIFRGLAPNALRNLADAVEAVSFGAGEALMREGEPGDALFVLTSGAVEVLALEGDEPVGDCGPAAGRLLAVIEVPAGEVRCVGEIGVVRRPDGGARARTASVIARARVEALRLGADRFEQLAQRDGAVAMGLVRLLAERLESATARELGRGHL
jgi:CRP-like cAMP-binding protein